MRAPPPAVQASEAFVAPPLQLHWQQRPYRHGGSPFSSTLLGTISVAPVASSGCSGACCCCRRHRRFCSTSCGHGASEANRLVGVGCGGPPVTTRRVLSPLLWRCSSVLAGERRVKPHKIQEVVLSFLGASRGYGTAVQACHPHAGAPTGYRLPDFARLFPSIPRGECKRLSF